VRVPLLRSTGDTDLRRRRHAGHSAQPRCTLSSNDSPLSDRKQEPSRSSMRALSARGLPTPISMPLALAAPLDSTHSVWPEELKRAPRAKPHPAWHALGCTSSSAPAVPSRVTSAHTRQKVISQESPNPVHSTARAQARTCRPSPTQSLTARLPPAYPPPPWVASPIFQRSPRRLQQHLGYSTLRAWALATTLAWEVRRRRAWRASGTRARGCLLLEVILNLCSCISSSSTCSTQRIDCKPRKR